MFRHRLAPEAEHYRLPQAPVPPIEPRCFALCPMAAIPGCSEAQWSGMLRIYERALEHAAAVVRPSIADRDLFAFRN